MARFQLKGADKTNGPSREGPLAHTALVLVVDDDQKLGRKQNGHNDQQEWPLELGRGRQSLLGVVRAAVQSQRILIKRVDGHEGRVKLQFVPQEVDGREDNEQCLHVRVSVHVGEKDNHRENASVDCVVSGVRHQVRHRVCH